MLGRGCLLQQALDQRRDVRSTHKWLFEFDQSDIAGALLTAITNPSTGIILPELTSVPPSTPTIAQAMMLTYMAIRNRGVSTAKTDRIYNDAGLPVFEAAITDDGVTFTRERITSVLV